MCVKTSQWTHFFCQLSEANNHLFIYWWARRLTSQRVYSRCGCAGIFMVSWLGFLCVHTQEWYRARSYGKLYFSVLEEPLHRFQQWLDPFPFPPRMRKCSFCFACLPEFVICSLILIMTRERRNQCSFYCISPLDKHIVIFNVRIAHLYLFFRELSIQFVK